MLYLRNTNQLQTLGQEIVRGTSVTPPVPPTPSVYFDGLGRREYMPGAVPSQTMWLQPAFFTSSFVTQTGSAVADSGSLNVTFFNVNTGSVEWKGYFKAATTETYTFYLNSDDQSLLWIGDAATGSMPLTSSALINVVVSGTERTGSISLTSGSYYGMRVEYTGVVLGTDYFTASFSTPTIPKTTNFTGYTYCNTASLGF